MSVEQTSVSVKVNSGGSGIIAVLLTIFFACVGFFFSVWLLGRWGLIKSAFVAFVYFIFMLLGAVVPFIGWFLILPITWIVMIIHAYKACSSQGVEINMPTIEKTITTKPE